ncbi:MULTISPECIES: flagellar hook-basal body protein [Bacillus]|uniref:flagellar hook-basal body protein n=1 Tax=Bacillus TaxID=1386 RepID=UPI0002F442BA|nr:MULTISPECIES: flagellar hook-basal body protein [Bacillus]
MNRVMTTASNTMSQLQLKLDLISNNVANIDTTGYKRKEGTFSDLLFQQFNNQQRVEKEKGRLTPHGINMGTGARLGLVKTISTQGNIKTTNRTLDVAFTKENLFFKINVNGKTQYTREGAFHVSPTGPNQLSLVTASGDHVLDENNQPIVFSANAKSFTFTENGTLRVDMTNGASQSFNLGIISVKNPQYLEHKQGNIVGLAENYADLGITEEDIYTNLTGGLRQEISVTQGALESSNVDLSKEMTDLISTQRQYQLQARSVTLADQMLGLINGVR